MTRSGVAYALPTSAPRTDGSECSSSPILPTPDATHGRKTTRTGDLLPAVVEKLFPTPTTDDANNVSRDSGDFQSLARTVREIRSSRPLGHPTPPAR
jgi:hypothetical protein